MNFTPEEGLSNSQVHGGDRAYSRSSEEPDLQAMDILRELQAMEGLDLGEDESSEYNLLIQQAREIYERIANPDIKQKLGDYPGVIAAAAPKEDQDPPADSSQAA